MRKHLLGENKSLYLVPFDDRPGKLFDGLQHCRATIFIGHGYPKKQSTLFTSQYQRWPTLTRSFLFPMIEYLSLPYDMTTSQCFPKYGKLVADSVCTKIAKRDFTAISIAVNPRPTTHYIFYQESTQYWLKATIGLPFYAKNQVEDAPAHGRYLYMNSNEHAAACFSLLNSSLFYFYFVVYTDCFHISDSSIANFKIPRDIFNDRRLDQLGTNLNKWQMNGAIRKKIQTKNNDVIEYDEFYGSLSKPIIDEIDQVLAEHYGFTAEELDFIINYDIKYRMGREAESEE